ncbi:Putative thiosulfate sulfurtransferase precursor [Roseivivax jejudonensis]|uniref:Putative thiosulfate sulfurtransferase n=1 Tax=Roseivivax jejudonensis TaxID=1529041 RepID=A0A1X7A3Q7_9RHOB|nr:rhodanese-like domain-containing protein [Roseivivax jejudonensis]SLN69731.1 Putative thiosulfate sulfurtransferase precursor [Roseivivax jejudonensis]
MKSLLAATTAIATLAATGAVAQSLPGPLATPEQVADLVGTDGVDVIDIRDGDAYAEGHVAGAVNAPYSLFRGPAENPGQVPDAAALTDTLGQLGLDTGTPVVITYAGSSVTDFGAAARVYWTLKSSGIEDLTILNGGLSAWSEAGMELSTDAVTAEASDIEVTWDDTWTASVEDVQTAIDGGSDTLLLDARPESFWNGTESHPAAARPGTLPQSDYFEHANWFSSGPAIIDADAARSLAEENELTGAENLISFCNTGHWAATNWFALSELAGIDNVKLYPESMVGWSNAGYDMANVPGPLRTLWHQIRSVF